MLILSLSAFVFQRSICGSVNSLIDSTKYAISLSEYQYWIVATMELLSKRIDWGKRQI